MVLWDLDAVEAAFPSTRATSLAQTTKYRNPDTINNASEELARLTSVPGKTSKAAAIAPHLDPPRNRSNSFQVLLRTFANLFPADQH